MPPRQLIGNNNYPSLRYSFDSFEGFLNAKLLVEVLKRSVDSPNGLVKSGAVGTADIVEQRKRIPQAAESIQNLDLGIKTPFSFGRGRNQALDKVYYTKIEKGHFVPLTDWKQWAK
jgi:hypothetical protein